MPLHPIAVVDHVIEEYRSYLRTEFRARDVKLRAALESVVDTALFLAQNWRLAWAARGAGSAGATGATTGAA